MKVLLSIKPQFAKKIFDGSKEFEFRKVIFNSSVNTVIVYASSPMQKVLGEFEIEKVISGTPKSIWKRTKAKAGINQDFFDSYFKDRDIAFAIQIRNPRIYKENVCIRRDLKVSPPQSFCYITSDVNFH